MKENKMLNYGSLTSSGKKKASYSPLREADEEADTAASRHTFSIVPVLISFFITVAIIYIVLMMKRSNQENSHGTIFQPKHHNPGEA